MFGLEILDVALGLVLTYLVMSLILTAAQEGIEGIFKTRAVNLQRALGELLQGDKMLLQELYDHPLVYALHQGTKGAPVRRSLLAKWKRGRSLPSYIPRETFAAALIDLVSTRSVSNPEMIKALDSLNTVSGGKVHLLRSELEGWYDAAMDRASGWYKRHVQLVLFCLGLVVAISLNVNSVTIARQLATDEQARAYADRIAEQIAQREAPPGSADANRLQEQLNQVGLPIGWDPASIEKARETHPIALVLGYLITALALMLGAPFWFDVLNRIMVIRSTVKPTEKSPDEPSEEGGTKSPTHPAPRADGRAPAGTTALLGTQTRALPLDVTDPDDELDGCLDGVAVEPIDVTEDVELPPATGGVELR